MLQIVIPKTEKWDEQKEEFVYTKEQTLQLEHSLVSLSKWESKWCKPFLTKEQKTYEETIDYVKCMTITQNVPDNIYENLSIHNIKQINEYIESPMSATRIMETRTNKINNEQVTSELIYYWMIALQIPFECQKWHLNRLLTLIRVCNIKNTPPKKMSPKELMRRNADLNRARRQQLNTKG